MNTAEDRFEMYVAHAIATSPAPLQELGRYLSDALDEDKFPKAQRLLLQLATAVPSRAAVAELVEAAERAVNTWPATAEVCGLRAALAAFGAQP